jgi:hypothetical protein
MKGAKIKPQWGGSLLTTETQVKSFVRLSYLLEIKEKATA